MDVDRRNTLFTFLGMLGASGTVPNLMAAGADGQTSAWTDQLYTLEQSQTKPAPFGATTIYLEGKTADLPYMEAGSVLLHPGQEPHPPHQHPEEEFVLIAEGHGHILVGGSNQPVAPGALMYSEGNKLHGIKNTSDKPMRFYFFKWRTA
jgi:quercetin dioxygenase-like cupin family protein